MTRDEIIAMFTRRLEYWRMADATSLAAAHAPTGTIISPMFGTVSGRPAIDAAYAHLFKVFHDWTIDSSHLLVDGNRVAQFYEGHSTHAGEMFGVQATGRRIATRGVFFFELDDAGLISLERRYYDFSAMLIQLGVLRPKTG
jgi:predicted ester cyclase